MRGPQMVIDVQGFPGGMYIVRLTGNDFVLNRRLIIGQ
jgi:hypothetical protein